MFVQRDLFILFKLFQHHLLRLTLGAAYVEVGLARQKTKKRIQDLEHAARVLLGHGKEHTVEFLIF